MRTLSRTRWVSKGYSPGSEKTTCAATRLSVCCSRRSTPKTWARVGSSESGTMQWVGGRTVLTCADRLAGYGKTILVQQNVDGLHVWDKRRVPPQDSHARLAGRARVRGPKFKVFRTSNPELPIAPFSHISGFTRHGLWRWRTFSHPARPVPSSCPG
jgi:hypothetical protein